MKRSREIVGLPVISISEVANCGQVKSLLVNAQKGAVDFLIIEREAWYAECRLVAFPDIVGIGIDALTVETASKVTLLSGSTEALDLLNEHVGVIGTRLMTKRGNLVGVVSEIGVATNSGKITGCEWIPAGQDAPAGVIPSEQIITFGRNFIVVTDHFMDNLRSSFSNGSSTAAPPSYPSAGPAVETKSDPLKFFEQQQRQYLLGRKVTKQIVAADGQVIAEPGQSVTHEMIELAVRKDKYVELTLNTSE